MLTLSVKWCLVRSGTKSIAGDYLHMFIQSNTVGSCIEETCNNKLWYYICIQTKRTFLTLCYTFPHFILYLGL